MPERLERCVAEVRGAGKPESTAWAICRSRITDGVCPNGGAACPDAPIAPTGYFRDAMPYDAPSRTAISLRDGVLEYYGHEIGLDPPDRLYRVYRSAATIANVARDMEGIPILADHVDLDQPPPTGGGTVRDSRLIDLSDPTTRTTLAVRNSVVLGDALCQAVAAGRRELSLGYRAVLVPHPEYGLEQRDLVPHHLAVVDRGRCGPACKFIDKSGAIMPLHKAFLDADGNLNLQQVAELAAALPEAIKAVPVSELPKLLEPMRKIVELAKAQSPEAPPPTESAESPPEETQDTAPEEEEDPEAKFADSVRSAVGEHMGVVSKAREFLPAEYDYVTRSIQQIMRDTLATDSRTQFTDSELPIAFKLLRKRDSNYQNFGDQSSDKFAALKDMEL